MQTTSLPLLFLFFCLSVSLAGQSPPAQPRPNPWIALPLGAVQPEGWLRNQLIAQREGLTGRLDEFWPDLQQSAWRGGDGEAWERSPYYLDGLIPLAFLLDDQALIAKVNAWMEPLLNSGREDGWFGPEKNTDRWPLAVACKVLSQYYEATRDERALNVLKKYFEYLRKSPPDWPDDTWRGVRAQEHLVSGFWLYQRSGDAKLLEAMQSILGNSFDWANFFHQFPWDSTALKEQRIPHNWKADGLTAHVVNVAMAVKYPGLAYRLTGKGHYRRAVYHAISELDAHHGQIGGRFSGDEHLSGRRPTQGTELCAVVEYMYSLEKLQEIFADPALGDRLEMLAYNALPATMTADCWAHQYDQQSNQVLVSRDKRNWSTNGDASNVYGLMPNFPCCLANHHQGWPKFVQSLWMATADKGLVAAAYGPSRVRARVGEGSEVIFQEETDYPFDGEIRFRVVVGRGVEFPFYLRIPEWASGATLVAGGEILRPRAGSLVKLNRAWREGDQVTLTLPMEISVEERYRGAVALRRGPLYYALRIGKTYEQIQFQESTFYSIDTLGAIDWAIRPSTPWNYGLELDAAQPSFGIRAQRHTLQRLPFADRGEQVYDPARQSYREWTEDPPIVLRAKGRRLPQWGILNFSAADPPYAPRSAEPLEELLLVPYGCTRLRVAEFPVLLGEFLQKK